MNVHQVDPTESKYSASAKAFRAIVTHDLANDELRDNFRGAMDYLMDKRKNAFPIED